MIISTQRPPSPPSPPQIPGGPAIRGLEGQLQAGNVIREFQAQIQQVSRQLQSLVNRRENMVGRLSNASAEQTHAINAEIAALDGSIAQEEASLANLTARMADLRINAGVPAIGYAPPPQNPIHLIDPDAITAVFVMFSIGIILPVSVGLMRRMWRRPAPPPPREADMIASPRLERLEQAVDAIAIEIERISEGQRFVTKVLSERPVQARPANPGERNEASALGDAQPFLALGAGPIEPIRAAERQAVRQSITPH